MVFDEAQNGKTVFRVVLFVKLVGFLRREFEVLLEKFLNLLSNKRGK
jgi:hypothetical protein